MSRPPYHQDEALGSTFLSLLDALAKEYERLQYENATLVATVANQASSSPYHKEDQDLPDPPKIMKKQRTVISQLSQLSGDDACVDQENSDEELPAEQQLSDEGLAPQMVHSISTAPCSSLPDTLHFEMIAPWKENPELIHQTVSVVRSHRYETSFFQSMTRHLSSIHRGSITMAIHPDSKRRHFWMLGCILFLLLDVLWVPVELGFDMGKTAASEIIHYAAMMYWTLDIPMSFLTGVVLATGVEMRLRYIARSYVRSWFCFDILILLPDYVEFAATDFGATHVSFLRVFRWGRFMRLLRVARLSTVAKMKPIFRGVAMRYHLSKVYLQVTRGLVGLILLLLIWMHVQTCLWHGFGTLFEDGWIQANNLGSARFGRLYTVSMHWSFCRLIGSDSRYDLKTVPELALDTFLMFVSLLIAALLLAFVTVLAITRTTSKPFNLRRASIEYSIRHNLSPGLEMRLSRWLEVTDFGGTGEIAEEEQKLLCMFPDSLKRDILFETRMPFVAHRQFIKNMVHINERAVGDLCYEAMTEAVLAPHEVIFHQGDAGQAMRFVYQGTFHYSYCRSDHITERINLRPGRSVSEAILWAKWEHIGQLSAVGDPKILVLDQDLFARTVTNFTESFVHAVKYAKHFVQKLNQQVPFVHDLMSFEDLDLEFLNNNVFDVSDEKHFIFISHYKVEAGTEATLIFDQMKDLLMNDPEHAANDLLHPVFVDSENLTDLVRLKAHVQQSAILLLLLTPGVLSRPWCLIEIATAIEYSVGIVLVDIQRPGSKFQYPDDEFYRNLLDGRTLESQSLSLLHSQGVTLESLEKGLRRIFCKISLPFSPHKSEEIREAELRDILKRCNFESSQNLRSDMC